MTATTRPVPHGTASGYIYHRCRCTDCRRARRSYYHWRRPAPTGRIDIDRDPLAQLLHELAPEGLTDQCPARQAQAAA
jgi:hypothetical protein